MTKQRIISVQLLKKQELIADQCTVAVRFLERLQGLIGRPPLREREAMYFPRCNSIHMWFMGFPLDVAFIKPLDSSAHRYVVTSLYESVPAWKLFPLSDLKARDVIEFSEGTIARNQIKVGDELCLS